MCGGQFLNYFSSGETILPNTTMNRRLAVYKAVTSDKRQLAKILYGNALTGRIKI